MVTTIRVRFYVENTCLRLTYVRKYGGTALAKSRVENMFGLNNFGDYVEYKLDPKGRYMAVTNPIDESQSFPRVKRLRDNYVDPGLTLCFMPMTWKGKRFTRTVIK